MDTFLIAFCSFGALGNLFLFLSWRGKYRQLETLYSYCALRRELMSLATNDKLDVNSFIFKKDYKRLSDLIRFFYEYSFDSYRFVGFVDGVANQTKDVNEKLRMLDEEIGKQNDPQAVKRYMGHFAHTTLNAFFKNSLLCQVLFPAFLVPASIVFFYDVIRKAIPSSFLSMARRGRGFFQPVKTLNEMAIMEKHYGRKVGAEA